MRNNLSNEIYELKREIHEMKERLVDRTPEHFSKQSILSAFFGALIIGLTFMFKGLLIEIGLNLPLANVMMIIASTIFVLSAEIYFIGYLRVKNPEKRPFGQFYFKRLSAIYGIALIVSFYLCYIFGIIYFAETWTNFIRLVFVLAMPCSIGAAVGNLLNKY